MPLLELDWISKGLPNFESAICQYNMLAIIKLSISGNSHL